MPKVGGLWLNYEPKTLSVWSTRNSPLKPINHGRVRNHKGFFTVFYAYTFSRKLLDACAAFENYDFDKVRSDCRQGLAYPVVQLGPPFITSYS